MESGYFDAFAAPVRLCRRGARLNWNVRRHEPTRSREIRNVATIAIGDVHGNRAALDDLLTRLEPDLEASDTVVFLGDYIDRGPDSKGCIDRILRFWGEPFRWPAF